MRNSKRVLAGIAAGALALGALTIASAPAASAKPSIKPKASLTGTVSGVRVSYDALSVIEKVPYASISWTSESSTTVATGDTVAVTLLSSPAGSSLKLDNTQLAANAGINFGAGVVATNAAPTAGGATVTVATNNNTTKKQSVLVGVNVVGTYTGTLTVTHGATGVVDTVSFAFTTTGAPKTMSITPSTATLPVNATTDFTVTLKDAAGNVTQPTTSDSIAWTTTPSSGAGAMSPSPLPGTAAAGVSLALGTADVTYTAPGTGGSFVVTGSPLGSLPSSGVAAQSVSITVQSTVALAGAIVAAPTAGVSTNNTTYTAPVAVAAGAPASSTVYAAPSVSTVTFAVTAATGAAGSLIPVTVADVNSGVTPVTTTIPVNASLQGTYSVTAPLTSSGKSYTVTFGSTGAQVVYTISYSSPALSITNLSTLPPLGTNSFVKTGDAAAITASVTDQFGLPLSNIVVTSVPSVSTASAATTGADGKATVSIPAPAASTTSQTVAFNLTPPLGSATTNSSALTLTYNSSGAPTSLTASSTAGTVAQTAAATQYVDVAGTTTGTWAATSVTTQTQWLQLTATVGGNAAAVPVTFSGSGLYFAAANTNNLDSATTKKDTASGTTNGSGVATIFVKATKTGTAKVTMKAGTLSTDITWLVANQASDARVIAVSPAEQEASGLAQVKATVTDAFGNTVANAALNFAETGVGNFLSGASTLSTATGPTGEVTVDVLSTEKGDSTVTVTAAATANYAGAADAPVTGAPKGVSSGVGKIKFTGGSATKSITIVGERATVSGKSGIVVEGTTTGLVSGKTVIPYVRFPGGEYSQGTARPTIGAAGDFEWSRKTGKKAYVYFTNDDGAVTSNRIIIAAG